MSGATTTGGDLQGVLDAASKLPVCDRAAKLHALLARVVDAGNDTSRLQTAVEALTAAATEALAEDPWFQFNETVTRLGRNLQG